MTEWDSRIAHCRFDRLLHVEPARLLCGATSKFYRIEPLDEHGQAIARRDVRVARDIKRAGIRPAKAVKRVEALLVLVKTVLHTLIYEQSSRHPPRCQRR